MGFKWSYLFNIETIGIILLIVFILYLVLWNGDRDIITGAKRIDSDYEYSSDEDSDSDDSSDDEPTSFIGKIAQAMRNTPKYKSNRKHKQKRINKHEEKCRMIFQSIFRKKFKSVRPNWLKNPVTNRNLELDGYCPDIRTKIGMGLAFEYDGEQHAKYNKHFHRRGVPDFVYQRKKDNWKDARCKELGILLIRIPHYIAYDELYSYIIAQMKKHGLGPAMAHSYNYNVPGVNSLSFYD